MDLRSVADWRDARENSGKTNRPNPTVAERSPTDFLDPVLVPAARGQRSSLKTTESFKSTSLRFPLRLCVSAVKGFPSLFFSAFSSASLPLRLTKASLVGNIRACQATGLRHSYLIDR